MTDRCDLTELLVDQCACTQHRGDDIAERPETVGQPIEARYEGVCGHCDRPIRIGQDIQKLADGNGYVHAGRCPS